MYGKRARTSIDIHCTSIQPAFDTVPNRKLRVHYVLKPSIRERGRARSLWSPTKGCRELRRKATHTFVHVHIHLPMFVLCICKADHTQPADGWFSVLPTSRSSRTQSPSHTFRFCCVCVWPTDFCIRTRKRCSPLHPIKRNPRKRALMLLCHFSIMQIPHFVVECVSHRSLPARRTECGLHSMLTRSCGFSCDVVVVASSTT